MTVVEHRAGIRDALAVVGSLFAYPDAWYAWRAVEVKSTVHDADLARFVDGVSNIETHELQSIYTSTFDLAPLCSPYLGIHLFGDEGRERARLMVGLRLAYQRRGEQRDAELPDHIGEVLRFAAQFDDDEWSDLATLVIEPALTKMQALFDGSPNPYRHLVQAALELSRQVANGGRH